MCAHGGEKERLDEQNVPPATTEEDERLDEQDVTVNVPPATEGDRLDDEQQQNVNVPLATSHVRKPHTSTWRKETRQKHWRFRRRFKRRRLH